jgi:DNA-binding HxlR family transcriptional regulator
LRRKIAGISARVLTVRLRALESEGLVYRESTASSPPEVTYGLTAMAAEIGAIIEELHHAANRWEAGLHNVELLPRRLMQSSSRKRLGA